MPLYKSFRGPVVKTLPLLIKEGYSVSTLEQAAHGIVDKQLSPGMSYDTGSVFMFHPVYGGKVANSFRDLSKVVASATPLADGGFSLSEKLFHKTQGYQITNRELESRSFNPSRLAAHCFIDEFVCHKYFSASFLQKSALDLVLLSLENEIRAADDCLNLQKLPRFPHGTHDENNQEKTTVKFNLPYISDVPAFYFLSLDSQFPQVSYSSCHEFSNLIGMKKTTERNESVSNVRIF